jgi:UDP-N-acetylenolpyruvoylglucosamine reductase
MTIIAVTHRDQIAPTADLIAAGGLIDRCALRGFCIGGTGDW